MSKAEKQSKGTACTQAKSMFQNVRNTTQLFAVLLSALLLGLGVYYFNILFVLGALLAALFAGRVFCGWICPNGAWIDHGVSRFSRYRKLPGILNHRWFGYGFTFVFLTAFAFVHWKVQGSAWVWLVPIGMMGVQVSLATILGGLYHPRSFCSHICPWGVLGALIGKKGRYQMRIDTGCKSCHTCARQCPFGGILEPAIAQVKDSGEPVQLSTRCMRCMRCVGACPTNALQFGVHQDAPKQVKGQEHPAVQAG
ncbi:4Fe-4S binding protein [Desulfonatronospira sp.]|uniref:4Fe-4S binding protein n=1 Tax=Desulfonatronospira sp. TaxID=1962951 RepID=UPI0025C27925|nr:4Fe-4S binding protein [Desulfonatronospira sp.]